MQGFINLKCLNNTGVIHQKELTKVQLGETAKPTNALTILGVNHHFNNLSTDDATFLLSTLG